MKTLRRGAQEARAVTMEAGRRTARMALAVVVAIVLAIALMAIAPARSAEVTAFRVKDGDTIQLDMGCSTLLPKQRMDIRVAGIDTPEARGGQAKCAEEKAKGIAATVFARTLIQPGDMLEVNVVGPDKYACRVVAHVTMPDGRDFGAAMIAAGHARPYGEDGSLKKQSWCPRRRKPPGTK